MRNRSFVGIAGSILLLAARAQADEQARLFYVREESAADCPGEETLKDAVKARMGYSPFFPLADSIASVEIRRQDVTYVARVRTVEGGRVSGKRELASPLCRELVKTVALSLSLAIDPKAVERFERTDPAPAAPPAPAATPAPAPSAANPSPPPNEPAASRSASVPARLEVPRTGPSIEANLALAGSAGTAPAANAGGVGEVRIGYLVWSLGVGARVDAPSSEQTASGGRVTAHVIGGTITPCYRRAIVSVCAVFLSGSYRASAALVSRPGSDAELHLALGPRLKLSYPFTHRLEAFGYAELMATFTPHTLYIDETAVQRSARAAVGFGIGLSARVW